jgi:hypothetical protein
MSKSYNSKIRRRAEMKEISEAGSRKSRKKGRS